MKCIKGKRCSTKELDKWAGILWNGKFYCLNCAIEYKMVYIHKKEIQFSFYEDVKHKRGE